MKRHDFESLVQEGWSKFTSISERSENDVLGERLKVMTGMYTKFGASVRQCPLLS